MSQRIVVVSDLHMAPPGPLDSFRAGHALTRLVASLGQGDIPVDRTTMIMNGDTFDFLQVDDRPAELDGTSVARLIETTLDAIAGTEWGAELFGALADFIARGGQWVVVPGNHDPELHHPGAASLLARALDKSSAGVPAGLRIHSDLQPWRAQVGELEVVVGHGHRSDSFNDIDPVAWREAMSRDRPAPPLPPGSRLVLDTVNGFKRAGHRFVDMLKPEMPGVMLLLLYIDRSLALKHLPGVAGTAKSALWRRAMNNGGPALAPGAAAGPTVGVPPGSVPDLAGDLLVRALLDSMTEQEQDMRNYLLGGVEEWIEHGDAGAAAPGSLADHGGIRAWLLRKALWFFSYEYTFFDPGALGAIDRAVIAEALPHGSGPRVVVAGHTHAARYHALDGERFYINTGTWTDLMKLPGRGDDLAAWIDDLEATGGDRIQRLSFADITAEGAILRVLGEAGDDPGPGATAS